jgi:nucleoside-diphosphate-sugar epimerase
MNFYRISKSLAIKQAEEFAKQGNFNLTVIHPVWVYGEREFSSGFYEYMKFVKSGVLFGPGSSKNYFHVIYARDLARAYYLALENAPAGFNSYIIGDHTACKQEEIFRVMCREMGVRKPMNLPKAVVWPIGLIAESAATILNMRNAPILSRARVNMYYDSICFSTQKAEEEISFHSRFSLEEGIKNTVKWYKDNHLI